MAAYRTIGLDRVLEVSNAPGTAAVVLGGAVPGYRSFASLGSTILAAGDWCAYFIEAVDGNGMPTGLWERGFCTPAGSPVNSFTRTMVIDGSNGPGNAVNFTGTVRVGIAPMTETTSGILQPGGRLTASTTGPVVDTSTSGSNTISYTPYTHDRITLFDGCGLRTLQFFLQSLPPLTGVAAGTAFDVFAYIYNNTSVAIESQAWAAPGPTNPARAVNLAYANGFLCKSSDLTRRYLGSFYASAANTTYDYANGASVGLGGKRFVWNMYNRVARNLYMFDNTASWTLSVVGWRIIRGLVAPSGGVEFFRGLVEDAVLANGMLGAGLGTGQGYQVGIGQDGTVGPVLPGTIATFYNGNTAGINMCLTATYGGLPGLGYRTLALVENVPNTNGATMGGNYGLNGLYTSVMA